MIKRQLQHLKVFFFTLIVCASFSNLNAQLKQGDVTISIQGGRLSLRDFSERNATGINLDITLSNNIGIHYNLSFGRKYFHAPLAPVGGGYVMGFLLKGNGSIGGAVVVAALLSLIPEGVSYNVPFSQKIGISPYISPLQFDFIKQENQTSGADSFAGGALGFKLNFLAAEKIRISPFGEYKIHYNKNTHPGIYVGVDIGYRITKKDENPDWIE